MKIIKQSKFFSNKINLILFFILSFPFFCNGQDGSIDLSFNIGSGFNDRVSTIEQIPGDKILVTGLFTTFDGTSANRIIMLNGDGSINNSFSSGSGFNGTVFTSHVQSDGKIIIGGSFTTYNGFSTNRIIRLMPDGTVDPMFNTGTGFNNSVFDIILEPTGKILIGGNFSSYNGVPKSKIVRLNQDGSLDGSFNIGTGFNSQVNSISLQPDNKIIVTGVFTTYNGNNFNRIVRLNSDGSVDNTFVIGAGFNGNAYKVMVQEDGKILVGGDFINYNGVTHNRMIRLNPDGTIDNTFNIGFGFSDDVFSFRIFPDGKIIVAGSFSSCNSITCNRIIKLNQDGSIDNSFIFGGGFNLQTIFISESQNNAIFVGGDFTTYQSSSWNHLVKINNCINTDTLIDVSVCNSYVAPDGVIYNASGLYEAVIPNVNGCDSLIKINLYVESYPSQVIFETTCFEYISPDGAVFTTSGIYNVLVPNPPLCDSLYIINLTVTMDTSVVVGGGVLTSNANGVDYQWYDCNLEAEIPGAVYKYHTVTYNGSFAVIITDGTCIDTSACYTIDEIGIDNNYLELQVYPNPTSQFVSIQSENIIISEILIYNLVGEEMKRTTQSKDIYIGDLTTGLYLIEVKFNGGIVRTTFIKTD